MNKQDELIPLRECHWHTADYCEGRPAIPGDTERLYQRLELYHGDRLLTDYPMGDFYMPDAFRRMGHWDGYWDAGNKPKFPRWMTVGMLFSFRQSLREAQNHTAEPPERLTYATYAGWMAVARAYDLRHHGAHTF
ncbi:MAG: hypothetical protein WC378_18175 [Opitutaceae bacterium]|jgi:hypothetical protein